MAFQGIFRRHNTFVVVAPIRITTNDILEVGTELKIGTNNVKLFQLRLWFKRRRIGTLDSPWANEILGGSRRPEGMAISKSHDIKNLVKTLATVAEVKEGDTDIKTLEASVQKEQSEADEAKAKLADAKAAKNKRERDRRAAAKSAKEDQE